MSFETFSDDRWLGAVAVKKNGSGVDNLLVLNAEGGKNFVSFRGWSVEDLFLSINEESGTT